MSGFSHVHLALKVQPKRTVEKNVVGDARLVHYMKITGRKAVYQHWVGLEEIRKELNDSSSLD